MHDRQSETDASRATWMSADGRWESTCKRPEMTGYETRNPCSALVFANRYRLLSVARYSIRVIAIFLRAREISTSPKSLSINRDFPYIGLVSRYTVRKSVSELHRAIERSLCIGKLEICAKVQARASFRNVHPFPDDAMSTHCTHLSTFHQVPPPVSRGTLLCDILF